MGNRAVVQFKDGTGVYLHWNGGPKSVLAFLDATKHFGVRTDDYGVARFVQIVGNFFGGTLSLGVGRASTLDRDNGDNGTYHIDDQFNISRREHAHRGAPKTVDELDEHERKAYEEIKAACIEINAPFFARG